MHAIDPLPRRVVVATVAALGLAIAAAALPTTLRDVSLGGSSQAASPAPAIRAAPAHQRPDWLRNPLASPLRSLDGR